MRRLRSKRFAPLVLVLMLAIGQSAGIANAEPAATRPTTRAAIQSGSGLLPGFGEPSSDVTIVSSAIGDLDPAVGEPATLVVERLRIAPGDEVPAVDGAQILEVEHGSLSYTDDLGLDAELQADASAFFAAGSATPITNEGGVPAIVLRTTISGATAEPTDTTETPAATETPAETPEDNNDSEDNDSNDSTETGERPTPTADDASTNPQALMLNRDLSSSAKNITVATPSASPAASPVDATPEPATPTPTPEPTTPPVSTAKLGVLLEADLTNLPASAQQFFTAELELQPGAQLELTESSGPIGIIANGGDLTVDRDGRTPAKLRDGRSVLLPTGTSATFVNESDAPLTLQIAGISGETATEPTPEETVIPDGTPSGSEDDGPIDVSGPHRFIPSDSEMEHLGLYVMSDLAEESSDTADNILWFTDQDQANSTLTDYDWQNFVLEIYTGGDQATEYGEVTSMALNVDTFADNDGATQFYNYIRDEIFQGGASHSRDINQLSGVDAEMRDNFYNSDDKLDYGFMVIRSGEYVVSLYLRGTDLNTIGLMEAVAKLIFGPRG